MAASLVAGGCSREPWPTPAQFPTSHIEGRITRQGVPLSSGWVTFLPIHGTLGDLTIAPINPDGTYSTDRGPVGELAVRVNQPGSQTDQRRSPFVGASSPLRVRSSRQDSVTFNFDLP